MIYLFIHRKDLRIRDMRAFDALKKRQMPGLHLLILDPELISSGRLHSHSGQQFLRETARLRRDYAAAGQSLHLLYGPPAEVVDSLLQAHPIAGIVAHSDYTPYALRRDQRIGAVAGEHGIPWVLLEDLPLADLDAFQAYAQRDEPYKVFTPFYRKWSAYMESYFAGTGDAVLEDLTTVQTVDAAVAERFACTQELEAVLSAFDGEMVSGETDSEASWPGGGRTFSDDAAGQLEQFSDSDGLPRYVARRDRFAVEGTSGISRYLNTGALSARSAYNAVWGKMGAESWIRQLAWRDFYLYQAVYNKDFFTCEQQFDLSGLSERHFTAWTRGETGIPIIDAAMTQLNETGELPNRLRMVTAMFLTKNLLCPFTLGEQYFRLQLSDYDNILNRGGWLWSSSLGYDASPYFRIMNPATQSQTHDPDGTYIRRWLPQLSGLTGKEIHQPRPEAIVDLKTSRARAIEVYKEILRG